MKNYLVKFFFLLFGICTYSQMKEKGNLEISPTIGVLSANYYGKDVGIFNQPIVNATYGLNVDYFFNDRWSLRSGLEFQSMGSKIKEDIFRGREFEEKLNYINIPIHANWHFGSTRKWYLNFGPSISFLTYAESNGIEITEALNKAQLGLGFGIGYKFFINEKISIGIDHQEYLGFSKLISSEYSNNSASSIYNYFGSYTLKAIISL